MVACFDFDEIAPWLEKKYRKGPAIVGLMLADYNTGFVKQIISSCYTSWNIESGYNFDVFWPGYKPGLEIAQSTVYTIQKRGTPHQMLPIPPLVNFNGNIPYEETCRLIEQDKRIQRQAVFERNPSTQREIIEDFENPSELRFYAWKYKEAKKIVRNQLELGRNEKINGMSLVLARYTGTGLSFTKKDCLVVNLQELSRWQSDPQDPDRINSLVSNLISICSRPEEFKKIKKKVKAEIKDNRLTLSDIIAIIGALLPAAAGLLAP